MAVVFEISPLFQESVLEMKARLPNIIELIKDFRNFKAANPLAAYGNSDKSSASSGIFNQEVPKIRHAHLTHDVSVWYTISGKNPTVFRLYGVFSHDQSGTGRPPSNNIQRKLAKKMAKQEFNSF